MNNNDIFYISREFRRRFGLALRKDELAYRIREKQKKNGRIIHLTRKSNGKKIPTSSHITSLTVMLENSEKFGRQRANIFDGIKSELSHTCRK